MAKSKRQQTLDRIRQAIAERQAQIDALTTEIHHLKEADKLLPGRNTA